MKDAKAVIPMSAYERFIKMDENRIKALNYLQTYVARGSAAKQELEELRSLLDV